MAEEIVKCDPGNSSDSCLDILCKPCSYGTISKPADRFCLDCQEYLCFGCSVYHKTLTATKNHNLVTTEEAKETSPMATKDKCSLKCTKHENKTVKYFCVAHAYLGCSICITMEHRQCNSVEYIPEVAKDLRNHGDFKEFDEQLRLMHEAYNTDLTCVDNTLEQIRSDERKLKEEMEALRKRVIEALDDLENTLKVTAWAIQLEEIRKLHGFSRMCTRSMAQIDALLKEVEALQSSGRNCDTYILMRNSASFLVSLNKDNNNSTISGKTFERYEFEPSTDFSKLFLKSAVFGHLNTRSGEFCIASNTDLGMLDYY